jgi:hypothetical protein
MIYEITTACSSTHNPVGPVHIELTGKRCTKETSKEVHFYSARAECEERSAFFEASNRQSLQRVRLWLVSLLPTHYLRLNFSTSLLQKAFISFTLISNKLQMVSTNFSSSLGVSNSFLTRFIPPLS